MAGRTKKEAEVVEATEAVEEAVGTTKNVYIVETPVENYCGIGAAGVQFAYGKAEVCEGWVLDWYREHGYKVNEKK